LLDILCASDSIVPTHSMNFLTNVFPSISLRWWVILIISVLGIAAICIRALETEDGRARRAERDKKKELRSLAERISSYAHTVHQRYPTGDVIVSERDLAEEFRKRQDVVITALNLLLSEQKVQKAPLRGYWKLRV
jgi:hypothetical protein